MTDSSQTKATEHGTIPPSHNLSAPYSLAAGLLWNNRYSILALYLALILPRVLLTLWVPNDGFTLFSLRVAERLIELSVNLIIVEKVLLQLGRSAVPISLPTVVLYFVIGVLSWLTLLCPSSVFPAEIIWTAASPGGVGPALFMALPAAFVWYVHYFWSVTLLLPGLSLPLRISLARYFVQYDRWAPVKVVLGPMVLCLLPTLLAMAPYPDGRSLEFSLLADCLSGIEWILCGYLTASLVCVRLPEPIWNKVGLEPYRTSRFSTLELQAPSWLSSPLRPKIACQLLALCMLLWFANMGRLAQLGPSPELKVTRAWFEQNGILRVELQANDKNHHFRAFRPLQFRIADKEGALLWAPFPESASIDGAPQDHRVFFPLSESELTLQLGFKDWRKELEGSHEQPLQPFKDYALWYGGVKVAELAPEETKT